MEKETKPRDRPGRLARFTTAWGVDLMLALGGVLVSVGMGRIYSPAGLIAAGMLLIAGGVLAAKGGGGA